MNPCDGFHQVGLTAGAIFRSLTNLRLVNRCDDQGDERKKRERRQRDEREFHAVEQHQPDVNQGKKTVEQDGENGPCQKLTNVFELIEATADFTDGAFSKVPHGESIQTIRDLPT